MSASFNIIPNVPIMAVQAVIFLANIGIIKVLFLDPYLKLKDKRTAATTGSQDDAKKAAEECEVLSAQITKKIQQASDEANAIREEVRKKAIAEKSEIIGTAEKKAQAHISEVSERISSELAEQKAAIPQTVNNLTNELFDRALNS